MLIPLMDGEYEKINIKQDVYQKITTPMYVGEKIGKIQVYIDEEKIYEKDIILDQNIYKKSVIDYFNEGLKNMFKSVNLI